MLNYKTYLKHLLVLHQTGMSLRQEKLKKNHVFQFLQIEFHHQVVNIHKFFLPAMDNLVIGLLVLLCLNQANSFLIL